MGSVLHLSDVLIIMTKTPSKLKIWILASRPKTLWAGFSPVLIGTAMAFDDGVFHLPSAMICLFAATIIQIGTNFANDYYDFLKGADTEKRRGPTRVTQAGLVAPREMKMAFLGMMSLVAISGLCLFARAGWPILAIAVASIISGILYTGGPFPLGYRGLGDVFVLVFFGPIAVGGTYYVQALDINSTVLIAGLAPGLLSTAILTVNNLRDIHEDKLAHKYTLAVLFGPTFAKMEYVILITLACFIPFFLLIVTNGHGLATIAGVIAILAIKPISAVLSDSDASQLNQVLATTGKLVFIYSLLFSIGWLL